MSTDRITKLRVAGMRSLADIELDLQGLTVLIGENGAGKSSRLEALELLRYAPKPLMFLHDIVSRTHGGLANLMRHGATELTLGVTVEGAGPRLDYAMVLGIRGGSPAVISETIVVFAVDGPPGGSPALVRRGTKGEIFQLPHVPSAEVGKEHLGEAIQVNELTLALPMLIPRGRADFDRILAALTGIELHVPFETRPMWQQAAFATRLGPRWPSPVERAEALDRYGLNLPNAFQELRNRGGAAWVRTAIVKASTSDAKASGDLDVAIRQIVSRAVSSDEVVDIFAAAGLGKPDISVLSDQFLADVKGMPHKNLAVELLRKLLADEVKTRSKHNLVQSRSFADLLAKSVVRYQNRAVEAAQIIEEMIALAKEMMAAERRGEELGLSKGELAFYDALEVNDSAVKILGDEALKTIAKELVERVRENATIDWTVKESVRAKLRAAVKRVLRKHGYPPDKTESAAKTVLEQAELLTGYWTAGA